MGTEALKKLLRSYQVKIAYLFGSQKEAGIAFLVGEERKMGKRSDLDIGIVFETFPVKPFEVYRGISGRWFKHNLLIFV